MIDVDGCSRLTGGNGAGLRRPPPQPRGGNVLSRSVRRPVLNPSRPSEAFTKWAGRAHCKISIITPASGRPGIGGLI